MLQKINGRPSRASILLRNAIFPTLFPPTLEYSSPARGTWNIVHTGMLVPESQQIYIGAAGCLRGVVLTAEEMGLMQRYAALEVREKEIAVGDQETFIITGVSDIIKNLSPVPKAVLMFTSCLHHFMGTDMNYVYRKLREHFPNVDFAPCIMDPIMSKTGMAPEIRERREIYRLLKPASFDNGINIIGNNLATVESCDLVQLIRHADKKVRDWTRCRTYAEFQELAQSEFNVYYHPFTHIAAQDLAKRLGQKFLYLPLSYDTDEIKQNLATLANALGTYLPNYDEKTAQAHTAMTSARRIIGSAPVTVDASFTFRPFNLARVLSDYGFNVTQIFADVVPPEDETDFYKLRQSHGDIEITAIKNADLRLHERSHPTKTLALGQKAAYLNDTPYFVNLVDGGGYYGLDGLVKLAELMLEAWHTPKDTRSLIQRKGLGFAECHRSGNVKRQSSMLTADICTCNFP